MTDEQLNQLAVSYIDKGGHFSQKTFLKHGITPDTVESRWPFRITENNAAIVRTCVDLYAINIFLPLIKCSPLIRDKIGMVCGADLSA